MKTQSTPAGVYTTDCASSTTKQPKKDYNQDLFLLRSSQQAALSRSQRCLTDNVACSSAMAILCIVLTVFTLFALYTGLQNIPVTTSVQQSLRNQTFICILIPLVFIYYTKMALVDYMRTFQSFAKSPSSELAGYEEGCDDDFEN